MTRRALILICFAALACLTVVPATSHGQNYADFGFESEVNVGGEPIPEPMTLILMGSGLLAAAAVKKRNKRRM